MRARFGAYAVLKRTLVGVLALVVLAVPASAQACSCAAMDPETQFRLSDGAVIARLQAVVPRGRYVADYRYRIREAFKARRRLRAGEMLTIRAARDGATCGLPQGVGRLYGLFLHRSGGRWNASLCDVTSPRTMRQAAYGGGRSTRVC